MHETSVHGKMRARTAERAPGCAVLPSYGFCECGSARGTLARGASAVHEVLQMQNQARPYARAVARDRLRGAVGTQLAQRACPRAPRSDRRRGTGIGGN